MGFELPLILITGFWAIVGIVVPLLLEFCIRHSPNKSLIQTMLILTAACCYLLWLSTFIFQMNPLIGPQMETTVLRYVQMEWPSNPQ